MVKLILKIMKSIKLLILLVVVATVSAKADIYLISTAETE